MKHQSEEDYLKAILHLSTNKTEVSTNEIADYLDVKASSVTDMLKKLKEKKLVLYIKYKGAKLSKEGHKNAIYIVRKHRLWEYFLVEQLSFKWDEVHEIAEQLEHIKSPELVNRLDDFLGNPKYDPHGDPIPDKDGTIQDNRKMTKLSECNINTKGLIAGVDDTSADFLQFLEKNGLMLGTEITVTDIIKFDQSMNIRYGKKTIMLSERMTKSLLIS